MAPTRVKVVVVVVVVVRNISYFGKCRWQRIALPLSAAVLESILCSCRPTSSSGLTASVHPNSVTARRGEARSVRARSDGCVAASADIRLRELDVVRWLRPLVASDRWVVKR